MRDKIQQIIGRLQEAAQQLCIPNGLMHETLHSIADDLEAAIAPQWVPVGERLPECGQRVFVINKLDDGEEEMMLASSYTYDDGKQWFMDVQTGMPFEGVTHWHEIDYPEPPAN